MRVPIPTVRNFHCQRLVGCSLPPLYSLFGQVVKGLDIVEAMHNTQTRSGDRPVTDVVINSVTISVAD